MFEEPMGMKQSSEAEPVVGSESRLERMIIRAIRLSLLVYLLPALLVTLVITWVVLVGWRAVLLVESAVRRVIGLPCRPVARKAPALRPRIPSWSHLGASGAPAPAQTERYVRCDQPVLHSERSQ
jgi:hypothetical protein